MRLARVLAICWVSVVYFTSHAEAQNTADATTQVTFTLSDVLITDTLTGGVRSATFETSDDIGDLEFTGFGSGSTFHAGGIPSNPAGSIGSGSASEIVSLNGLDPSVDSIDLDSFNTGDSLVLTMTVFAANESPDSVFLGEVDSDHYFSFETYGEDTDQFTFLFDYSIELTSTLDNTWMPGATLAKADGQEIIAIAENMGGSSTNEFIVASDYYTLFPYNSGNGLELFDQMTSGSHEIAFDPGDNLLEINFINQIVVNSRVSSIPEPATAGVAFLALIPLVFRRRRS